MRFLAFIFFLIFAAPCTWGQEPDKNAVLVGLSFPSQFLTVKRKPGTNGGESTNIRGREELDRLTQFQSAPWMPWDSIFGIELLFNAGSINFDLQRAPDATLNDVGTNASGIFLYSAPVTFIRFGSARKYLKIGYAYGVGYMDIEGTIDFQSENPPPDIVQIENPSSFVLISGPNISARYESFQYGIYEVIIEWETDQYRYTFNDNVSYLAYVIDF